jgi:hypothetical protein
MTFFTISLSTPQKSHYWNLRKTYQRASVIRKNLLLQRCPTPSPLATCGEWTFKCGEWLTKPNKYGISISQKCDEWPYLFATTVANAKIMLDIAVLLSCKFLLGGMIFILKVLICYDIHSCLLKNCLRKYLNKYLEEIKSSRKETLFDEEIIMVWCLWEDSR